LVPSAPVPFSGALLFVPVDWLRPANIGVDTLTAIYVSLGIAQALPRWLVFLVVSRDILIVGGVMLAWLIDKPIRLKPLLVSKLNTVAQIVLALLVLAMLALGFDAGLAAPMLMGVVAALTLLSIGFYVAAWVRHMSMIETKS